LAPSWWTGFEQEVEALVGGAIQRKEIPGAVALVSVRKETVLHKAYGYRSLLPTVEEMTLDTIFDLASLTKPVATATLIHGLISGGKLSLARPLGLLFAELEGTPLGEATLEHLLLHTAGLDADLPDSVYRGGLPSLLAELKTRPLLAPPGALSRYSDVGYQLLGALASRLGGAPLGDLFAHTIAAPLGTPTLTFSLAPELRARAAPTEQRGGVWRRGVAHDPKVAPLGGAAGHAGLFGTAAELATFCRMLLAEGEHEGQRVLPPQAVASMLARRRVPKGVRTAGWDVASGMRTSRGDIFPERGAGHLGFTGTSIWMDPPTKTTVILLTSRLHPDGKGDANPLRKGLSTAAGRRAMGRVLRGLDVAAAGIEALRGKRLGLLTHAAAVDLRGRRSVEALREAGYRIEALFSPEHGLAGKADARVSDGRDEATGLPVHSLYGTHLRPTEAQLAGLDALVIDLQDAGCRFYTYPATVGHVLEEASRRGLPVFVLDRPNPLGGIAVEGPLVDEGRSSFVAYHRVPVRHGMTLGELARMMAAERGWTAPTVIPMVGWRRSMRWEATGLPWINPSPNLRSPTAALLYPGIGLLELTNLSVGRGTDRPFEQLGAPWLRGAALARALNDRKWPGVQASAVRFTPTAGPFEGEGCEGVRFALTDPDAVAPVRLGLTVAMLLRKLHTDDWKPGQVATLLENRGALEGLLAGKTPEALEEGWREEREAFLARRKPFLLHGDGEGAEAPAP
jgi:uncharacterized protein YbbC (DUF1343 family)